MQPDGSCLGFLTAGLFALLSTDASATPTSTGGAEGVFAAVSPSVVVVETFDSKGKPLSLGSGVVVAAGRVVTNFHVVRGAAKLRLRQKSETWPASVLRTDRAHDLCLLSAKSVSRAAVSLRASNTLRVGERVYAVGSPEGLELTLSDGLIAALRQVSDVSIIQTSAPISHGSSGGGLFDASGRLVGITTSQVVSGQNLNFAMPTEWLTGFVSEEAPATEPTIPSVTLADSSENPDFRAMQLFIAFQERLPKPDLMKPGDEPAYLERCDEIVRLSPNFIGGWLCRGEVYHSFSNTEKALSAMREAVRVAPTSADAWHTLAIIHYGRNEFVEGQKAVDEAIRLAPEKVSLLVLKGDLSGAQGHYEEAVRYFRKSLDFDSESGDAWRGMAKAYNDKGDRSRALDCAREAVRVKPDDHSNWFELGLIYMKAEPEKAIEPFRRAYSLSYKPGSSFSTPCQMLALALNNADRLDEALMAAEECVDRYKRCAGCLHLLVAVNCRKGNRDKALEIYSELRALDKSLADDVFKKCLGPGV